MDAAAWVLSNVGEASAYEGEFKLNTESMKDVQASGQMSAATMVTANSQKAGKTVWLPRCGGLCISFHHQGWFSTGLGRLYLLDYMGETDTFVLFVIVCCGMPG